MSCREVPSRIFNLGTFADLHDPFPRHPMAPTTHPIDQADTASARHVPLAMTGSTFREVGHELVETIAALLEGIPAGPVTKATDPASVRVALDAAAPLPEDGMAPDALLREAAGLLAGHSLFNGHPKFFGYITAPPAPIGILGDFLAAAVNSNVGAWTLAPMATEIEGQAVRWIADLLDYPQTCGGLFVSGGNMANTVGLLAARTAAATWDVQRGGVGAANAAPLRVYASAETHTWIQKATEIAGLGSDAIRWIPTDAGQRMDVSALRLAILADRAAGLIPMMVVGTAGSVSTGAVDALDEIADVCAETGTWFHVDGAYGALAVAVPGTPLALRAMRRADSIAMDPHKWLYAPLEAGCALVRDADVLRRTFSHHPPYYHFGVAATNYVDFGPQNSRGFRALKVWLQLRQAGRAGYVQMIGDDIRLSEQLHTLIEAHPELEAVTQALSITTFRFVPEDLRATTSTPETAAYLNTLNQALLDRIQHSGEAFVSNAVVHGRYLLRACVVNLHTTAADIDAIPEIIVRLGREVDAEQRGGGGGR
jgi:glutamate/tyrosine decarboxylase-like PLP-dependent enzyme